MDFGARNSSVTMPSYQSGGGTQAPTSSTSSTTQSGSSTGTVKLTIREPNAAPIIKNLSGAYANYNDASEFSSNLRTFTLDSLKSYTKAELVKQSVCPAACNSNDSSCNPPCTLGQYFVTWNFCAEDNIKNNYTTCLGSVAEPDNSVEYLEGELNLAPPEFPKMGFDLPYLTYAFISRCEKRSGDVANKFYNYTASKDGTKNGHFGSLDFVRFDKEIPTSSNNPLISFKFNGGRFVELSPQDPSNIVYFYADIDASNVPVVKPTPCTPR